MAKLGLLLYVLLVAPLDLGLQLFLPREQSHCLLTGGIGFALEQVVELVDLLSVLDEFLADLSRVFP